MFNISDRKISRFYEDAGSAASKFSSTESPKGLKLRPTGALRVPGGESVSWKTRGNLQKKKNIG